MPLQVSDQPAKKQSKWSPEEDALIIELRGRGMKWEDISKQLPGRSAISCRLHYQNYLERRSEWPEECKDKLAQLYERFKPEIWAKIAEELARPWRAVEAMHWQLGEAEMARRAGVVPFSLAAINTDTNTNRRNSPSRGHHSQTPSHIRPHGGIRGSMGAPPARILYGRNQQIITGRPGDQAMSSRRESFAPQPSSLAEEQGEVAYNQRPMLAPIQTRAYPAGGRSLPSISEMTTGIAPYSGVTRHVPNTNIPNPTTPHHGAYIPAALGYSGYESPRAKKRATPDDDRRENNPTTPHHGAFMSAALGYSVYESPRTKRRASPEDDYRATNHRRRLG